MDIPLVVPPSTFNVSVAAGPAVDTTENIRVVETTMEMAAATGYY